MTAHPNVARHRAGHDAFRRGDVQFLSDLFSDDTVWHWPGRGPMSGDFRGKDNVLELLGRFAESCDSLDFVDEDFLASDSRTASLSRMKLVRGEKALEFELCEVVRWSQGQVVEEWLLVDDVYAYDEFWS